MHATMLSALRFPDPWRFRETAEYMLLRKHSSTRRGAALSNEQVQVAARRFCAADILVKPFGCLARSVLRLQRGKTSQRVPTEELSRRVFDSEAAENK